MINEIASYFENGVSDLIKDKGPTEKEPHLFLLFNCPQYFFKKYCKKDLNIIDFKYLNYLTSLYDSCDPKLELDAKIANRTLEQIMDIEDDKIEEEITTRNNYTNIIEEQLNHIFEHFDNASDDLISDLIKECKTERISKMKKECLASYEKLNKINKKVLKKEKKKIGDYTFLEYDDLVLIFARIIKYFTDLDIQLSFTDLPNSFALSIYGNEKQLSKLAEKNEYELQLKNYALKYEKILEEESAKLPGLYTEDLLNTNKFGEDNRQLLGNSSNENINNYKSEWIPLKYADLREKDILCFTPTEKFRQDKEEKFQRYNEGDEYHECNVTYDGDEICGQGCSKFRGIDKLRIIYDSIDGLVKMNYLKKGKIINYILLKRNYMDYGERLSVKNIIFKPWNIFNRSTQMEFLFTIRNFFNEEIAYYFLWLTSLVKWLIFPAFFGIIVNYSNKLLVNPDGSHNATILLLLSAFLALWGTTFLKYWTQKEKIFNYIWGTDNFQKSEPDSESYIPDGHVKLVFNKEFPYVSPTKAALKRYVSYVVLVLMIIISGIGIYLLFYYKVVLIEKYPKNQTLIGIISSMVNTLFTSLMSNLYFTFVHKLNDWQNHRKDFERINALAGKFILYSLINSYYPLFYIAFLKKTTLFGTKEKEKCYGFEGNNSCLEEIEMQLYTTLSMNFVANFKELRKPLLDKGIRMIALKKKLAVDGILLGEQNSNEANSPLSPHSIDHQMILNEINDIRSEYSEIILDLGYLLLFGVVAPLVPILVLLLVYTEKFFDAYKFFFLSRIKLLDKSNGLNIYNNLIKYLVYVGMLSNVAFLIFGDNYFMPEKNLSYKIVLYCAVEFTIFILTVFVKWNILPSWFEYLDDIKEVYHKNYFRRDGKSLPHLLLIKKKRYKKYKKYNQIQVKF